ncbi:MAG TPA: 6-bladed beta-propeller [Gemmataceae bacterium]|nr:6-bladed beta-propeller [Gemmataceae bacterium]
MSDQEYLFPRKVTRRDFLAAAGATAGALALGAARADEPSKPVTIGQGKATYTLDQDWGKLPTGMTYGFGCALVVDSKDRVFVTSRSASPCVAIFDKDGKLQETWSKDFGDKIGYRPDQIAATAHGLYWNKEADGEYLYWTENVAAPKDAPKIGARVYKTDLQGRVLYTIGNVEKENETRQKFDFTNPTDLCVAANGDIYVVDGYGSQLLYRFDKDFKHIKTIGGPGKDHGKFNTCHGIWISTLKKEPEIYVADRANNRVEIYSMDLEYKRTLPDYRLPCCFYQHEGQLYVPELGSRVTILDADDRIMTRMGDGAGVKDVKDRPELFGAPHALTVAGNGDLYVTEWLPYGRPRKFRPTPA